MSRRLALLNAASRRVAKPMLRSTKTPERARRDFDMLARVLFRRPRGLRLDPLAAGGAGWWVRAESAATGRAILYLHGGAYIMGSPRTHCGLAGRLSVLTGLPVCLPAYRLAPRHPFPAAFDDAQAAWTALRDEGFAPGDVILGGDSAGGGLALALLAELCGRGEAPAGLFAFSPWTDLTMSGATLTTNAARDRLLPVERMPEVIDYYLAGAQADDPRASPLLATFTHPPPVFLQAAETEILLDDSRRMAARLTDAGGQATLDLWPDAPHVWPILDGWIPEARAALERVAAFVAATFRPVPARPGES